MKGKFQENTGLLKNNFYVKHLYTVGLSFCNNVNLVSFYKVDRITL